MADPRVYVPKVVRDADGEANDMISQYAQGREGTPREEGAPEPETGNENETPEPAVATEPSEPSTSPPAEEPDAWQQKYNVLKGKFDAEVPVLTQQVSYLMQQNQVLEQKIQEIETNREARVESPSTEPVTSELPKTVLDHEKVKYFQKEYEDIFEPTIILCRSLIQEAIGKLERKFEDRLSVEKKQDTQSKKNQFYDALDKAYPDWETIQKSPEFGAFMREPDPLSGIPRWHLMKDAYDKFDAPRAIRFFDHFFGKTTANLNTNPINPSSEKLGNRIAPPQSRTGVNQGGNGTKMSPQKARQEYEKLSNLRIRNKITEAEFKKEEARLWPLMQER